MSKNNKGTQSNEYFRAPIVTIMGHVDHGKTSLLDYIRNANVQSREYGGITQHIGAYQVIHKEKAITFIDTPGHEAFSQMRARGGKAADIVVLVVAADDGVQLQTIEAIKHAKAANATIIVAINKIDVAGASPDKVKQQLAENDVIVEDWGGDIQCVNVSAKNGDGIPELLDTLLVVAEMKELKANPDGELEAIIIEAKLDKKKGVTVTSIVRNGSMRVGQEISAGGSEAKIRSLMDDKGNLVKVAEPADPVEILGFKNVPNVGDLIVQKGSELAELSMDDSRVEIVGQETKKTINVMIKADTQGTLEAVKESLANLVTQNAAADFSIKFMNTSTGDINDSDISMASTTNSVIVGFAVGLKTSVKELADTLKVSVKTYKTIYELIDDIEALLEGTASQEEKKIRGRAQVLKIFKLPSGDNIAGCKVIAGALKPGSNVAVYTKDPSDVTEDDTPNYVGKIKKIKHGKGDIEVAGKDTECGLLLKPAFNDLAIGMWIEVR